MVWVASLCPGSGASFWMRSIVAWESVDMVRSAPVTDCAESSLDRGELHAVRL